MLSKFQIYNQSLEQLPNHSKLLITTINSHSYNVSRTDDFYQEALMKSDILIPDGISVVHALKWLKKQKLKKIAGADLFNYELQRLEKSKGSCFFLGSSESTLQKIKVRIASEYPNITVQSYSPPFKKEFSEEDNKKMFDKINAFKPDVLMVGMTAPKQEKWAYRHYQFLDVGHICCIGAVFDFYSGTIKRAPKWMINMGLEWLYRLFKEPKRMWKRYLIGNIKFIWFIIEEKLNQNKS